MENGTLQNTNIQHPSVGSASIEHASMEDASIDALFARQVALTPDAVALAWTGGVLSYRALDERANSLARHLAALHVEPEERIGVCLPRSPELIVALLAILKVGGAYLALDPGYPEQRASFLLRDAGVRTLLTSTTHASRGAGLPHVLRLDQLPLTAPVAAALDVEAPTSPAAARLAYVCYTSGSTGVPKGVEVTHAGVVRLVRDVRYVRLDATRRLLHAAPAAFDATTFELWGALLNGGSIVLYPDEVPTAASLRELIDAHAVTTAFLTTALVNAVVDDDPRALGGLSQLLFGGEAVSVQHIAKLQQACPALELIHVYGPTETTTFATAYPIRERIAPDQATIPIGRAIEHTELQVLDEAGRPVPVGETGELYIGGRGVARGYLGRSELTAQRFVQHASGARLYRTGDLVRMLPSGDVVFAGRVDHQVKLRGHRIELGEIESRLRALPAVKEAVVLCREDSPGDKRLVAYVVPERDQTATPLSLRAQLARDLPDVMVPRFYVPLPRFPLTSNGKIDRKQLPVPDTSAAAQATSHLAPRTEVERALAELWEALLNVRPVGVHDDFVELGGHSLLATRMITRVRERFRVELPLSLVLRERTVAALSRAIEAAIYLGTSAADPVVTREELVL